MKKVKVKVRNYPIWAVELMCLDERLKPHHWELWNTHNTKSEALEWIKQETNPKRKNPDLVLSRKFFRVRRFEPADRRMRNDH